MSARPSYDEKQANALLKICAGCKKPFYFTDHDANFCGACWEQPR